MEGVSDLYGSFLGTGRSLVSVGAGSKPDVAGYRGLSRGQAYSLARSDYEGLHQLHSGITPQALGNRSQFPARKALNRRMFQKYSCGSVNRVDCRGLTGM